MARKMFCSWVCYETSIKIGNDKVNITESFIYDEGESIPEESRMSIHENGDEFLRPTNRTWKCPNCGMELYTRDCIQSHKERCKEKRPFTNEHEEVMKQEREKLIQESLTKFKREHNIK